MANPANNGTVIGRLASDPTIFTNSDGSKSVHLTVFANRTYTDKNGVDSDAIPMEAFVPADVQGVGAYSHVFAGSLVAVTYALKLDRYMDKSGNEQFKLKVVVDNIRFLESRNTTQERLAQRVRQNKVNAQAQQAQAQPVQAQAQPVEHNPAQASMFDMDNVPF